MQTNPDPALANPPHVPKKRLQYKWLTDEQKRDLIFRAMYLNENVRAVCRDLGINFLTGRNLVQKYKKTGEYDTQPKVQSTPADAANMRATTRDTNRKLSECPLGIILLDDNKMKLVSSKTYSLEEEIALICLHSYFKSQHLV